METRKEQKPRSCYLSNVTDEEWALLSLPNTDKSRRVAACGTPLIQRVATLLRPNHWGALS